MAEERKGVTDAELELEVDITQERFKVAFEAYKTREALRKQRECPSPRTLCRPPPAQRHFTPVPTPRYAHVPLRCTPGDTRSDAFKRADKTWTEYRERYKNAGGDAERGRRDEALARVLEQQSYDDGVRQLAKARDPDFCNAYDAFCRALAPPAPASRLLRCVSHLTMSCDGTCTRRAAGPGQGSGTRRLRCHEKGARGRT